MRHNKSASDQAAGSRRSIAASDSLNIPVNSFSLKSRMPQSAIPDVVEHKYVDGKGFTESRHKASVLEAAERNQMSLKHQAITSVRGKKTMDSFGLCCPSPYYGRRDRKAPANDED